MQVLGDIEIAQGIERDKERKQKEVCVSVYFQASYLYCYKNLLIIFSTLTPFLNLYQILTGIFRSSVVSVYCEHA